MSIVRTVAELEAVYGLTQETSLAKVADRVTPHYRAFIEAAPFAALATVGPEGIDCSPRGDRAGFVRIHDERTLMLPDRRGNNRIDSLRNVVRDPRVALMFMIPGHGNCIRVNGEAEISIAPDLLASFAVEEKAPRSVMVLHVREIYFQCARAIVRSEIWNPARHVDPKNLPTPGDILRDMTDGRVGGAEYDSAWTARARETLW